MHLHQRLQISITNIVQTLSNITCQRGAKSLQEKFTYYGVNAGRFFVVPLRGTPQNDKFYLLALVLGLRIVDL